MRTYVFSTLRALVHSHCRLRLITLCGVVALFLALSNNLCLAQEEEKRTPTERQSNRPPRVQTAPARPAPDAPDETLRIDTDLVLVDVTVTDADGRPVRDLHEQDFKLYEDAVERPISFFNVERKGGAARPIAVVFAVDVSGSMTPAEVERLREALVVFTQDLAEHQAVFALMTFGMNVKTLQTFTRDSKKLDRALDRLTREPNGLSTHAYDAVDDAIRLLSRHAPRTRERRLLKRAVIVVTDGFPVGDTVAPQTVIERANAADVSVYTVTLPSFSRLMVSTEQRPLPTPLDVSGLVERTGGMNVYATDKDFAPLFRALAEDVTSSYVLAFYPTEEKRHDGRVHTIRVTAPPGLLLRQSRETYQSNDK
jgi:Ca-activated chloride channel family protein